MTKWILSRRQLIAGMVGVVGLLGLAGAAPLTAAPAAQPIDGSYTGTSVSVDTSSVAVRLVINPANKRKLTGQLTVDPSGLAPVVVDLKGTLSASGNVSLLGRLDGARLLLKGKFTPADAVTPAPKKIEGRFKLTRGGDRGTFSVTDETFAPPAP